MRWLLGFLKDIVEAIFDSGLYGGRRNPHDITAREQLGQQSRDRARAQQVKGDQHRDR